MAKPQPHPFWTERRPGVWRSDDRKYILRQGGTRGRWAIYLEVPDVDGGLVHAMRLPVAYSRYVADIRRKMLMYLAMEPSELINPILIAQAGEAFNHADHMEEKAVHSRQRGNHCLKMQIT